ncbi:MAG: TAXI family TRAP transporter solute-binding subunit [Desulfuromonadales bacterium]|nr:TAXI family TRAP transporter solute-binding subunit [Desulfuromonadales bacterium]
MIRFLSFLAILAMVYVLPVGLKAAGAPFKEIGTSGLTEAYYPVGQAIIKVFDRQEEQRDFRLYIEPSSGARENIDRVVAGHWDFGIARGDLLYQAEHSSGLWQGQPQPQLRAIAALYPEAVTMMAAVDTGIKSLGDLRGKRVSIGVEGSGDPENMRGLLRMVGLNPEKDLEVRLLGPVDSADQLQKGDVDAYCLTIGHPNLALIEASSGTRKMRIIEFEAETIRRIKAQAPYFVDTMIQVKYYPNLENSTNVATIGAKATLFTLATTPDAEVAAILNSILGNFKLFRNQHPALQQLKPQDLATGLALPLHPGAEEVYQKRGLLP